MKYKTQFEKELIGIRGEMENSKFNLSNLDLAIEKAVKLALNLPKLWVFGNLEEKRRLQKLVFPEGILYNREKDTYRTFRVNTIFKLIPMIAEEIRGKENGANSNFKNLSRLVPRMGVEPTRLSTHAPQACMSTNSTTRVLILEEQRYINKKKVELSSTFFLNFINYHSSFILRHSFAFNSTKS